MRSGKAIWIHTGRYGALKCRIGEIMGDACCGSGKLRLSLEIPFLPREFLHIPLPLTTLILSVVRRNRRGWFLPPLISIPERESNSKLGLCVLHPYLGTHAHAANYLENQFGTTNLNEDKERTL